MLTIKTPVVILHNTVDIPLAAITMVFVPPAGQIDHIEFLTGSLVGTVIGQNSISISGPLTKKVFYVPFVTPPTTAPLTVVESTITLNIPLDVSPLGLLDPAIDSVEIESARIVSTAVDFYAIPAPIPGVTLPVTTPPFASMVETDILRVEYKVVELRQLSMEPSSGNIVRLSSPGTTTVLTTTSASPPLA
ncbi:MAG: hypothetical protein ACUVRM_01930 [Bacillota bacterium]